MNNASISFNATKLCQVLTVNIICHRLNALDNINLSANRNKYSRKHEYNHRFNYEISLNYPTQHFQTFPSTYKSGLPSGIRSASQTPL